MKRSSQIETSLNRWFLSSFSMHTTTIFLPIKSGYIWGAKNCNATICRMVHAKCALRVKLVTSMFRLTPQEIRKMIWPISKSPTWSVKSLAAIFPDPSTLKTRMNSFSRLASFSWSRIRTRNRVSIICEMRFQPKIFPPDFKYQTLVKSLALVISEDA